MENTKRNFIPADGYVLLKSAVEKNKKGLYLPDSVKKEKTKYFVEITTPKANEAIGIDLKVGAEVMLANDYYLRVDLEDDTPYHLVHASSINGVFDDSF